MRSNNVVQLLVSVIIPTFNSGKFLAACLESLKRQTWREMEVIIVDDGSMDSTLEIAKIHECRVIKNPKRGRAEAKNEGIRRSLGEYLLFIDSDMELHNNVTNECIELVKRNQRIGGVVIPERSVGSNFWVKVRDFERASTLAQPLNLRGFSQQGSQKTLVVLKKTWFSLKSQHCPTRFREKVSTYLQGLNRSYFITKKISRSPNGLEKSSITESLFKVTSASMEIISKLKRVCGAGLVFS